MAAINMPPLPTLPAIQEPDQPAINPAINIPYNTNIKKSASTYRGATPMANLQNQIDANLGGLSGALNQISLDLRAGGGGTGGGSEPLEGNQDPNPLIRFNPYLGKNVTSFNKGGVMQQMNMLAPYISSRMIRNNMSPNFERELVEKRLEQFPLYGTNPIQQQIDLQNASMQSPFGRRFRPEIQKKLGSIMKKRRSGESMTQEELDTLSSFLPEGLMKAKKLKDGGKMKLTPKELQKISNLGRFGDTRLAHVTPQEERMLKAMGGAGTINPYTGLPEYYGNPLSFVADIVGDVLGGAGDIIQPIVDPVFDAAGSVVDPIVQNVVNPVVDTAGGAVNQAIQSGTSIARDVVDSAGNLVSDVGQAGMDIIEPGVRPIFQAVDDVVLEPVQDIAGDYIAPIAGGFLDLVDRGIKGGLNLVQDVGFGAMDVFETITDPIGDILQSLLSGGGSTESLDFGVNQLKELKRGAMEPTGAVPANIQAAPGLSQRLAQLQKNQKTKLQEGDFVSPKDNPFITPNVEEELDYAAQGMKMPNYNMGGILSQRANEAIALNEMSALTANAMRNRANKMKTGGKFKPHMMYDPKTGKAYKANKVEDHNRMSKKGYTHTKPNKKRNYTKGGRF